MKVAVVGAGIAGLTCAQLLKGRADVRVFERNPSPGGLVRCKQTGSGLFHLCGGHVFNTKLPKVADWFWGRFRREDEFVPSVRKSAVAFDGDRFVDYPIENHVYQLDPTVYRSFVHDLDVMGKNEVSVPDNFADFLQTRFGKTLYDLYFRPYNEKIWRCDLSTIPLSWLNGKLPMPSVEEMRAANRDHIEETSFVHSSFWYPRQGGSQLIVDRLSEGVEIICGANVDEIAVCEGGRIAVMGEMYDHVIYCGDVRVLPKTLRGVNLDGMIAAVESLRGHGTTTAFCEIAPNPYSWVYQPSPRHQSHRIICTGNFASSNNILGHMTATVEFTDFVSDDEICRQLPFMPFSPRLVESHFTPCSYPIQDDCTRDLIATLKRRLQPHGIGLVGRFAEWEYFNMDAAMQSAIDYVENMG